MFNLELFVERLRLYRAVSFCPAEYQCMFVYIQSSLCGVSSIIYMYTLVHNRVVYTPLKASWHCLVEIAV